MEKQIISPQSSEGPVTRMSVKLSGDCLSPFILKIEEPRKLAKIRNKCKLGYEEP